MRLEAQINHLLCSVISHLKLPSYPPPPLSSVLKHNIHALTRLRILCEVDFTLVLQMILANLLMKMLKQNRSNHGVRFMCMWPIDECTSVASSASSPCRFSYFSHHTSYLRYRKIRRIKILSARCSLKKLSKMIIFNLWALVCK